MFDASKCISPQEGHLGTLNLNLLISNCNALESCTRSLQGTIHNITLNVKYNITIEVHGINMVASHAHFSFLTLRTRPLIFLI